MKGTNKKILGILSLLIGLSIFTFGQTKEDVINLYNKAAEMANTDPKAAVDLFEEALAMAKELGADADTIKNLIETQIPSVQYKVATTLYKDKNIIEAIPNFQKAAELATLYGNDQIVKKAEDIIPKLYFSIGNDFYKDGTYDQAIIYFDSALLLNPDYSKVYLSKGLLYRKQDNTEAMIAALDEAIAVGNRVEDDRTVKTAGKMLRDHYLKSANQSFKGENWEEAIDLATQANSYGEQKPQTFYLLAVCNNKLSQWDNALQAANDGLAIEQDSNEAKAKFYYEIGNANVGKGDTAAACAAFKNAAYGSYAESANYQIETVLQCN
jgi:tetratricopeptide (TPR) repeat protein